MRTYYIYKATNKLNNKMYIGETVDFKTRVWQHMRCYEKEDCKFHDAIKKYGYKQFDFEIIETTDSYDKAIELEKKYISLYDTYHNGYNMNKGGVGGHNSKPIVCLTLKGAYVKTYDSAMQAEIEDGFCNSDVLLSCKDKISQCKQHMFMFEEDYLKKGSKVYKKPENPCMKKIIQCDLQGNFIKEYDSVQNASKETHIRRTTISGNLTNTYKSAGGYIWVYKENYPIKDMSIYKPSKKGHKVAQIDIQTNETVALYDRVTDAAKEVQGSYKYIHKVLDTDKVAYGYKWISQ